MLIMGALCPFRLSQNKKQVSLLTLLKQLANYTDRAIAAGQQS
jgi:hypothetical protein